MRIYPERHLSLWANGLVIAALIYVVFALLGKNYDWLSIEVAGVLLYAIPAILSLKYSKYWLAVGWALHVLWDVLLHANGNPDYVPMWYPGVCLGFDLAIAGFVVWWLRKGKAGSRDQVVGSV